MWRWLFHILACLLCASPAAATVRTVAAPTGNAARDTVAINRANRAAVSGDTVQFESGNYALNATIRLKSGVTYTAPLSAGLIATTLNGASSLATMFSIVNPSTNITISNLQFNGNDPSSQNGQLLIMGDANGSTNNITVTNNIFNNAAVFFVWLETASFTYNTFENSNNGSLFAAIGGYYWNNLTISHNHFSNNYEDISLKVGHTGYSNTHQGTNGNVSYNVGSGTYRMAIEITDNETVAGDCNGPLIVEGNWWNAWNNTLNVSAGSGDGNSEAYSIVCDVGRNTQLLNNYADGATADGTKYAGMSMENSIGPGYNYVVSGNDLRNFQWNAACYGTGTIIYTKNNFYTQNGAGPYVANPPGTASQCVNGGGNTSSNALPVPTRPAAGAQQPPSPR